MMQSFLLLGQSNMAGRGFVKDLPPLFDEHIKMLRNGRWQPVWEPIHNDRPTAGVGLAASFAAAWRLKYASDEIGLIPCADGGTSLDDWAVGEALFDHAVSQAQLAQRSSQLTGILWHQGENDSSAELAHQYGAKFTQIVAVLRRVLQVPTIPLLIGGLGDYLPDGRYGAYFADYHLVNEALQSFANTTPNCYFVTAAELTANPDGLHFDAISQRLFGLRYFEAFDRQQDIMQPLADESSRLNVLNTRPLSKAEQVYVLENRFASGELSLKELQEQTAWI